MANLNVKDAAGTTKTLKATDTGGVLVTHQNVDTLPADPFGANADAAVVTDASGSISAKLRGLVKMIAAALTTLGQKAMAASMPVVIASDQSAVPVSGSVTISGTATVAASENHIGETGHRVAIVSVTPTVSTSPAYTAGDAVGGLMSFLNATRVAAGNGIIRAVVVADKAKQSLPMDLVLFGANPGGTTVTDNGALTIADADLLTCVGLVPVLTAQYSAFADNSAACVGNLNIGFALPSGTTLYGVLVARGTPTFAGVSDITVRIAIEQN